LGSLSLGAKRSGTKDFSAFALEKSKYQRFRNGPALECFVPGNIPTNLTTTY